MWYLNADAALTTWPSGQLDAVLVDVPCSSERERLHRVKSEDVHAAVDALWDERKARSLSRRQLALLLSAMERAPGGRVVYSTCAMSKLENDDVIAEALGQDPRWRCDRSDTRDTLAALDLQVEETEYGWRLLPDKGGWGPIYWSVLGARR